MVLLIALSTLLAEDLACIAAGLLVAEGKLSFAEAVAASLIGIFVGDVLLYAVGCGVIMWPALSRMVASEATVRASTWLRRRGGWFILLSRFTPGLRLPTYLAAGLLRFSFARFCALLFAAAAVWTPLLVGLSAWFGEALARKALANVSALLLAIGALAFLIRRLPRWEFWPSWLIYVPVIPYFVYLSAKHRSIALFTAANPGIFSGGLVGESKSKTLAHLRASTPVFALIPASLTAWQRIEIVRSFQAAHELGYPIVLKPDVGERGRNVAIIRSGQELGAYLRRSREALIVQEYVQGPEFGIFYYRYPHEENGRIYAITAKHFPSVKGDGVSTVEQLIRRDRRASEIAVTYLRNLRIAPNVVPATGERVRIVDVGAHCRGAIFQDATQLRTAALEKEIDRISKLHPGFYFGRYDIRVPSIEDLQAGKNISIIELNGVAAEATHIYDPAVSVWRAYRSLFHQWHVAYEIGDVNRNSGFEPMSARDFLRLIWQRTASQQGAKVNTTTPMTNQSPANSKP